LRRWAGGARGAQGLSNIVWAYAKMGAAVSPEVAALLDALAAEAVSQLRDARARQCFIPQNVSNMVYGRAAPRAPESGARCSPSGVGRQWSCQGQW